MKVKVVIGKEGLTASWQARFPETVQCYNCAGEARHAFTAKEHDGSIRALHKNEGKGNLWVHDCVAVAIYFCRDCLSVTAKYNQA